MIHSIPVFIENKAQHKKNCFSQTAQNHVITIMPRSRRGPAFLQHKIRPMSVVAPRSRGGPALLQHKTTFIDAKVYSLAAAVAAWQWQCGGGSSSLAAAACVEYPYIKPGYKIHIQAPILPITRYYKTSPNDSP